MAYTPSVGVDIRQATTTGQISSLNHVMVADVNTFHKAFVTPYYSLADLNADTAVPKESKAYAAIQMGLANASNLSLPIYLGRVQADDTTLTPVVEDNAVYSFDLLTIDTTTGEDSVSDTITFTSDVDATSDEITAGLTLALTAALFDPSEIVVTDNVTSLEIAPAANRQVVLTNTSDNLVQTFTTTQSAANAFSDITGENLEDWYRMTTTVRDVDWIMDMAAQIQATESGDYPKLFHVSSDAATTIVAQTDPSVVTDLAGLIEDQGYGNTTVEWHDQSDTIFPEVGLAAYVGGFFVGTKGLKFSANASIPEARHPTLGRTLTKAEVGFITDRGAIVRSNEMKVPVYITGKQGDTGKVSNWLDNLSISHWIRLTMKLRVFNALVNNDNSGLPLTFSRGDRLVIKERADSVLDEAVSRRMLAGHTGVSVPDNVSFEDQAERMLKDLTFTGYYAGKINFVLLNGILTYSEDLGE